MATCRQNYKTVGAQLPLECGFGIRVTDPDACRATCVHIYIYIYILYRYIYIDICKASVTRVPFTITALLQVSMSWSR